MSRSGRSTPPRDHCITLPAAMTPRGTAFSRPSTTSAIKSLYAVKLSFLSASYQTWASRYFSLGSSCAPAHSRTRRSAAAPSHARSRSAIGKSWKLVTAIGVSSLLRKALLRNGHWPPLTIGASGGPRPRSRRHGPGTTSRWRPARVCGSACSADVARRARRPLRVVRVAREVIHRVGSLLARLVALRGDLVLGRCRGTGCLVLGVGSLLLGGLCGLAGLLLGGVGQGGDLVASRRGGVPTAGGSGVRVLERRGPGVLPRRGLLEDHCCCGCSRGQDAEGQQDLSLAPRPGDGLVFFNDAGTT